ncbi:unnamed protein product [Merluccius merluccius]
MSRIRFHNTILAGDGMQHNTGDSPRRGADGGPAGHGTAGSLLRASRRASIRPLKSAALRLPVEIFAR